jgi:hypothetical protein
LREVIEVKKSTVILDPKIVEQLEKAAEIMETTVPELIVSALDMYLHTTGTAYQIGWNPQK